MEKGAAILSFSDEFGLNAVSKAMVNDGPNLKENQLPNKVTPYLKHGNTSDSIKNVGGSNTPGYSGV